MDKIEQKSANDYQKYVDTYTFASRLRRLGWNICGFLLLRPFALPIFRRWRAFVLRCWGAQIGVGCAINANAKIWAPWNLKIGHRTAIGAHAIIYNPGLVELGSKVTISQYAYLCTATHDYEGNLHTLYSSPIVVGDYAWVAARAYVGPGVSIGHHAIVGATASVYKDIEPWAVVGGNPARLLKWRVMRD